MKLKVWCLILLGLSTINSRAQHACCTGSGSANLSLGLNSESLLMPKKSIGIELTNMAWFLRPQLNINPTSSSIADIQNVYAHSIGWHYGILKNLTITAALPYLNVNSEVFSRSFSGAIERQYVNSNGLGDMAVLLSFQPKFQNLNISNIAIVAGLELPTGKINEENGVIIASMGSQSWDPIIGLGYKKQFYKNKMTLSGRTTFKMSTTNDLVINYGNFWNSSIIGTYNFDTTDSTAVNCHLPSKIYKAVSIGLINDLLSPQTLNTEILPNTGYSRLYASVGGVLMFKQVKFGIYGDLPIFEVINHAQNKSQFKLRTTILISLNHK